jgi:hypothetical protein
MQQITLRKCAPTRSPRRRVRPHCRELGGRVAKSDHRRRRLLLRVRRERPRCRPAPSSVRNWRRLRSSMGSSPEPAVPAYSRLRVPGKRPQVLGVDLNLSDRAANRQPRDNPSVSRASQADRACLERAGRSQSANGRLRYVEAPCHVSLRFAIRKPLNRFLPLVGC